jgi:nitroreductase
MKNQLLDLFQRRYACHLFHTDRAIAPADLDFVLEAGRLSPSSFGLEHWKFLVVTSAESKQALQAACFNQAQVGTAAALVVVLARITDLAPDAAHARKLIEREYPGEQLAMAMDNYRGFHANTDVRAWSISQCHIAAANMMTAATAAGLDSCAIGGFLPDRVHALLGIDPADYAIALILALGYCADEAGPKQRLPLAEMVEYR